MNRLSTTERAAIVRALVEGNSIRATCRMTGAAKGTVTRLMVAVGRACDTYQDRAFRDLPSKRIQCDEIWAFSYAKQRNVKKAKKAPEGAGSVWTWVALDPDTKLVPTWLVGDRTEQAAANFIADLARRIPERPQITTDGLPHYVKAIARSFKWDVDFAQLIKVYDSDRTTEARYSPAVCVGSHAQVITGNPDSAHISTSHVERQNLTMRMSMRRFTRLTNGFSKKVENLEAAVALHFAWYNLARPHQSLGGKTPAMAAGVADHRWTAEEIVGLLDAPAYEKGGPEGHRQEAA
jgi:IS1 family transposase